MEKFTKMLPHDACAVGTQNINLAGQRGISRRALTPKPSNYHHLCSRI